MHKEILSSKKHYVKNTKKKMLPSHVELSGREFLLASVILTNIIQVFSFNH